MGIKIIGTGSYLPTTVERAQPPRIFPKESEDELIALFSGAQAHRVCLEHETATFIGMMAARDALSNADIDPKTLDAVICYTGVEDNETPKDVYGMLNGIGCDGIMAWTMDTACASFLSHLQCANALSSAGKKRILIVEAMNWVNRAFSKEKKPESPAALVGDGAGAVIVESVAGRGSIVDVIEKTSSANFDFIRMGSAQCSGKQEYLEFTASHKIIYRAFSILPETAQEVLARNGLNANDVTWTISHQPGINAIERWHDMLGIPAEKNLNTFTLYGNMSAANIPVTLNHFLTMEQRIGRGDMILAFTAGAGIHCAAMLIQY